MKREYKNFLDLDLVLEGKTIFLDVDGTIVSDKNILIDEVISNKIKTLISKNDVYICSNGSPRNAFNMAEIFGCKNIKVLKPFTFGIDKDKFKNVVVIGDKFLTDGLFAYFLGGDFIKVNHIKSTSDKFLIKFSYKFDDFIWKSIPFIKLARIHQWIKNLLVFAPIFFAGSILNGDIFIDSVFAFFAFSFSASAIYVLNDITDMDQDILHINKKHRPIASGLVHKKSAYKYSIFLFLISLIFVILVPQVFFVIIAYILLNLLYSHTLKHTAIFDIILIAIFYLLRIVVGGLATGLHLSEWIIMCTFFGSLFIIIAKRRTEFNLENKRKVLESYSKESLDVMLSMSAVLSIMSYAIYSILGHNDRYLVYSTFFVTFVIFKIFNHIYQNNKELETPETFVFKDKTIFSIFICWVLYIFLVFYF